MSKLHYCVVKYSCTNIRIKRWKVKWDFSEDLSLRGNPSGSGLGSVRVPGGTILGRGRRWSVRCWRGALLEGRLGFVLFLPRSGGFESPGSGLRAACVLALALQTQRFPSPSPLWASVGYSFLKWEGPSWPWLRKQVFFAWLSRAGQRHLT